MFRRSWPKCSTPNLKSFYVASASARARFYIPIFHAKPIRSLLIQRLPVELLSTVVCLKGLCHGL